MTKKQARNARNQRNKYRLWSDINHRPMRTSGNSMMFCGNGGSLTVYSDAGVTRLDGVSNEQAAAIVTGKAMEMMER